ncbi:uncharacterized protein LOC143956291 isoform X2 [Lithobates pipiens]
MAFYHPQNRILFPLTLPSLGAGTLQFTLTSYLFLSFREHREVEEHFQGDFLKMDKVPEIPVTDRLLDLTLEIIYLLTGEDYTVVKKTSRHHKNPCSCSYGSQGWNRSRDTARKPPTHKPVPERNKMILDITNEIIELLTKEVPIRCQDVTVYFSKEEWEYLEGHWDVYKHVMENRPALTSPDGSSNENSPERCTKPQISQKSTQELPKIPQNYSDGGLIVVKVEVEEEAEEPYIRCKEEEIPAEIGTGEVYANRTFKKEDHLLGSHNLVDNILMIPSKETVGTKSECSSPSGEDDFESDMEEDTKPVRNGEGRFSCGDCGKHFRYKAHLTVHQRIHTGERPYKCPECGKCFATGSQLTSHKTSHSEEKRYECSECGKRFRWKSLLVVHERRHRGEKPFECRQCGKAFAGKSNLLTHERSHIGERPFTCSECGKCFVAKHTLSRHMVIHTGEKPFTCPECGRQFKLKQTLCSHLRTHTRTQPSEGADYKSRRVSPYWGRSLEEPQVWPKYP